ncbi:MAG: GNAT family N-acetyltransferase [Clostridia bacterium]
MIRKITKTDREIFISMASQFYKSEAVLKDIPLKNYEITFDELMRSDVYAECYIFEIDGKTAGYALTAKTFSQEAGGIVVWIDEIFILPEFRSKGLGSEFLNFITKKSGANAARYRLEVEDENTGAIKLYERFKFRPLGYSQMYLEE